MRDDTRVPQVNVGSLFTGVGGFDLGLERAGHRIVFQCEKDPFRRRVLAHHWPDVPCYGDVREVAARGGGRLEPGDVGPGGPRSNGGRQWAWAADGHVDLLCGGFPCQDLSQAGARRGLGGDRSGLFFEFARIADELVRPGGYALVENVPGLFTSPPESPGRDFAIVLRTLVDIGFRDISWRVLDSRYFGVPQRRRRVYILGRRATGTRCAEVLLEPESGGGDPAQGRQPAPGAANGTEGGVGTLGSKHGPRGGWRFGPDEAAAGQLVAGGLKSSTGGADDNDARNGQLIAGTVRSHMRPGSNSSDVVAAPITSGAGRPGISPSGRRQEDDFNLVAGPITRRIGKGINTTVDDGAAVVANGDGAPPGFSGRLDRDPDPKPDGPRYAAMGDAVTVPVAEWIGRRL